MRVDKIFTRFYDKEREKWVVVARVKRGKEYVYKTLYSDNEKDIQEGSEI